MAGLKNTLSGKVWSPEESEKEQGKIRTSGASQWSHPSQMDIPNTQEGTHNLLPSFSSSYHTPSSVQFLWSVTSASIQTIHQFKHALKCLLSPF